MSTEIKKEIQLEIAHVLFMDIVGYSKLLINEQRALLDTLNQIVRGTDEFRTAEAGGSGGNRVGQWSKPVSLTNRDEDVIRVDGKRRRPWRGDGARHVSGSTVTRCRLSPRGRGISPYAPTIRPMPVADKGRSHFPRGRGSAR